LNLFIHLLILLVYLCNRCHCTHHQTHPPPPHCSPPGKRLDTANGGKGVSGISNFAGSKSTCRVDKSKPIFVIPREEEPNEQVAFYSPPFLFWESDPSCNQSFHRIRVRKKLFLINLKHAFFFLSPPSFATFRQRDRRRRHSSRQTPAMKTMKAAKQGRNWHQRQKWISDYSAFISMWAGPFVVSYFFLGESTRGQFWPHLP
jgi:hypothetical protein